MSTPAVSTPRKDPNIALRKFGRGALIAFMLAMLAFVLLPMFWMILTAFKTQGTAFRLAFVPQTVVMHPPEQEAPFILPGVDAGERWLHAEIVAPGAQSVQIEQRFPGGRSADTPMRLLMEDRWIATWPLPDGEQAALLRVVVDGDPQPIGNWIANDDAAGPEGFRPSGPLAAGNLTALTQSWLEFPTAGDREVRLSDAAPPDLEIDRFVFSPTRKGETIGEFEAYRILENRPFGEALAEMYTVENFATILSSEDFNFGRFFMNSLIVATSAGLLTVLLCTMAGFAFATKRFHYREALFRTLLASMLVPGMIFMVPQFSITLSLGWLNSFQGMVVPHLANVFGLFLLRQYIGQIPRDLFSAAEIDSAHDFQVFDRIVVPICLPIMVTLFVLVFVGQWSNFLWQLIVNTGDPSTMTLPVGLQQFKGQNATEWELIMAGACFSLIPITVLFFALQKYFLSGLTAGAVKE